MAVRRTAVVLVFATLVVVTVVVRSRPAGGEEPVRYRPPVDAPVVDPFRAPPHPYGGGNRGLTYDLEPGTPVRAAAGGEVVFAGPVAGTLHVTVLHPDGLRTSYSFLESVSVRRGQRVDQGDVVGTGGPGFHLGVRSGDAYLDPAALFAGTEVRVRLIPHEEPLPPTDAGLLRERIALQEKVRERGLLQRVGDFVLRNTPGAVEVLGAGLHVYDQLSGFTFLRETTANLHAGLRSLLDCTRGGGAVSGVDAGGRVAVLVAGHNSTSARASIDDVDVDELGYHDGDVLRYSYAGGRVPDPDGRLDPTLAGIPARPYDETHTWEDLEAEGADLAGLILDVADARPGAPIDVYAHSQGGIVTRLALAELERRGEIDVLGQVVTIGTPHQGTDLATGAQILDPGERETVEWIAGVAGTSLAPGSEAVRQMSESSALIHQLRVDGVPEGVEFRTIGARGDLVVTGDKTTVDGHPAAMVGLTGPAAHENLPGSSATTHELALALAGKPPSCRGALDLLLDATVPEIISFAENAAIAGYSL